MVSCCGQAKDQPGATNSQHYPGAGPGIIDSQPAYQPALNYGYPSPGIPTPPATHPPSHDHNSFPNGFQPQMTEFGGPPTGSNYNGQPPMSAFQQQTGSFNNGSSQPPMRASSPFQQQTGSFNNGSNFNSITQSITRPASAHSPHSPPPQVNAPTPIQDEGKMSISIDFGVYTCM
jgi:hypothetical protein